MSGPLPPGVAALATDRYKADLAQDPPAGEWHQASDGAYLFCSFRPNASKNCGAERQFCRLEDGILQMAESDHLVC